MADAVNEVIQRPDPLLEAAFDQRPFVSRDDAGNDVERKDMFRTGLLTVHVERNAHSQQGAFSRLVTPGHLAIGEAFDPLDKGPSLRRRRTVRQKQLVVEPVGAIPVESQRDRLLFRADYRASRASASRTRAPRRMPPNE